MFAGRLRRSDSIALTEGLLVERVEN